MKTIALFLNTSEVGGAERSIVEQMRLIKNNYNIIFYIPQNKALNKGAGLIDLINSSGFSQIKYYWYPEGIYLFSRTSSILQLLILIYSIPLLFISMWQSRKLATLNFLYANGTKAALYVIILSFFTGFKGVTIWHFRDYPPAGIFRKIFNLLFKIKRSFQLMLIGNSNSVKNEIEKVMIGADYYGKIYNPMSGRLPKKKFIPEELETIGIVAMFAPWKGIHEMIKFAVNYSVQLKELGIKKINIYGGPIYKTRGKHLNYEKYIKELKIELNADLINFCGEMKPFDIYKEIDLLIHPSLKPEPFGRIIMEAFQSGIPVISTGLGGSGELVIHEKTGWIYNKDDFNNLFSLIKIIRYTDKSNEAVLKSAYEFEISITNSVKAELEFLLEGKTLGREIKKIQSNNKRS